MTIDEFWLMVQQTRPNHRDAAASLAALTHQLQELGEPAIQAFEQHLREQLAILDTLTLRDVAAQLWVLSDEAWLHFRGWCISQGSAFMAALASEPGRVLRQVAAERDGPFDLPDGELFLYCADYARVARTRAVA